MPTIAQKTAALPSTGLSRFAQIKPYIPISREKFRQLSRAGRAPQPIRMGVRCTFYENSEVHEWLKNPLNYRVNGDRRD